MTKHRTEHVPSDDEKFARFRLLMNVGGLSWAKASHEVGIDRSTGWAWAAYAGITKPKRTKHWTRSEEKRLLGVGRGQLRQVAQALGRTYFAAYRHRERLLKCSNAHGQRKG